MKETYELATNPIHFETKHNPVNISIILKFTAQKIKFFIEEFQFPADLVTFTEEILNGKLHFLYSDRKTIKRFRL